MSSLIYNHRHTILADKTVDESQEVVFVPLVLMLMYVPCYPSWRDYLAFSSEAAIRDIVISSFLMFLLSSSVIYIEIVYNKKWNQSYVYEFRKVT